MKRPTILFFPIFLLLIGTTSFCIAADPPAETKVAIEKMDLRAEYTAAAALLAPHTDGFSIDDDATSASALSRKWNLLQQITVEFLSSHHTAKDSQIADLFSGVATDLQARAFHLDPKSLLIAVSSDEVGTVFIVTEQGGKFTVAWSVANIAADDLQHFASLRAWSAENAKESCRTAEENRDRASCGPLSANVGALPAQSDGAARFYIAGTYAQIMGATVGGQFSIWKWSDGKALPLYVTTYTYLAGNEDSNAISVRGETVRIRTKDSFKTFLACGSCEGREVELRIQLGPNEVKEIGKRSLVPELDLVDTIFERLFANQPIDELADPAIAKVLQPFIDEGRALSTRAKVGATFGLLNGWNIRLKQRNKVLCVELDEGSPIDFTIGKIGDTPRILSAKVSKKSGCAAGKSVALRE